MRLLLRWRNSLLDRLVPPFKVDVNLGPTFFVYAAQKSLLVDGCYVCPQVEPLIPKRSKGQFNYLMVGEIQGPQAMPSVVIPRKLHWGEFFASLFFMSYQDWIDFQFLMKLMYSYDMTFPKQPSRLFCFRAFLLGRYFAQKLRGVANVSEEAYVMCYYNAVMLGVVSAFRKVGKPVWDIQHGYLGESHAGYNNANAFAIASTFRPSGFLVWDRRFGEHIEKTLDTHWESTDYLHIKAFASKDPNLRTKPTIMYSLQTDTAVPKEIETVVKHFVDVKWVFRMHPNDHSRREDLQYLRNLPNAEVVGSDGSLSEALCASDLHLTFNSSVIHEAAILGIPSLCLDETYVERFRHEAERGLAFFSSGERLIPAISDLLAAKLDTDHLMASSEKI